MNAWGVERQPPRLPTGMIRASGQCSSTASLTKSSISTTSASLKARTAFRVINSGSPGPAPTSQTFALIVFSSRDDGDRLRGGGQQTLDFRDAGAALRATAQFLFQALQVQATANAGADRALADVFAVAQGFVDGGWRIDVARRCAQWRQQPAPQLLISTTFEPQALQPMLGEGFTGQANRGD